MASIALEALKKLEDTSDLLKEANYLQLFFISFYKDFEKELERENYSHGLLRLKDQYKIGAVNLSNDKNEQVFSQNLDFIYKI